MADSEWNNFVLAVSNFIYTKNVGAQVEDIYPYVPAKMTRVDVEMALAELLKRGTIMSVGITRAGCPHYTLYFPKGTFFKNPFNDIMITW